MKQIGLFAGIGGFELAAKIMGWETIAWCEKDPFCRRVLNYYFPNAKKYADIKTADFSALSGKVDILTGGFPCQPYSTAGKRLGSEDDRHLWPEMLRVIRQTSPRWIVGENVRGLISWDGGMVFNQVQTDLEAEGYEVVPFLLPACGVDAPHERYRIWFVAHAKGCNDRRGAGAVSKANGGQERYNIPEFGSTSAAYAVAAKNANCFRCDGIEWQEKSSTWGQWMFSSGDNERLCAGCTWTITDASGSRRGQFDTSAIPNKSRHGSGSNNEAIANTTSGGWIQRLFKSAPGFTAQNLQDWRRFPTESPLCGRNDGVSGGLVGITIPAHRRESIKAYGNAVVPQVVLQIYKAIEQFENLNT